MSTEQPQPLSAILAEMRAARNAASDMTLVPTEWLSQWADRIEAAAEHLRAILAEMRDERIIRLDGEDVTRCVLCNLADRIEEAVGLEGRARPVVAPGARVVRDTLRRGEPIIDSAGRYVGEMPPEESTL